MSFGGGKSTGKSWDNSQATSSGQSADWANSGSFVDPNQAAFRNPMWATAADQMQQQMAQMAPLGSQLYGQGQGFMQTLQGLANPQAQIAAQDASLKSGMTDILKGAQFGNANAAMRQGAFGGSRQGVMDGAAAGEVAKAYQQGYGDIVARANAQAGNASMGGLGSLQNLGMLQGNMAWNPMQQFASLLGDPTVLQKAMSGGLSTDQSQSTSSAGSRQSEKKFSIGLFS